MTFEFAVFFEIIFNDRIQLVPLVIVLKKRAQIPFVIIGYVTSIRYSFGSHTDSLSLIYDNIAVEISDEVIDIYDNLGSITPKLWYVLPSSQRYYCLKNGSIFSLRYKTVCKNASDAYGARQDDGVQI